MASPLPLEGDGLIENLFYFLWCKDDFGAGPCIYVPHTVVYKFTQPSAWYFTSLKSGKIKKKTKANLNNVQIEHEFCKKKSPTDIVAYYIYVSTSTATSSGGSGSTATSSAPLNAPASPSGKNAQAIDAAASSSAMIEYFDIAALRDFLYKREKTHNGILQKFVLPKGTNNATIRAVWSPKICLLERAANQRNVYDKRFGVYERGVTFDGPDAYSRPEPVRGAILPGEIQRLCEQVVDHVTQVSYHKYRISRMVLHLKTDADDRVWLLWCSSLRLPQAQPPQLSTSASCNVIPASIRPLDIVGDAQVPAFAQFGRSSSTSTLSGAVVGMRARQRPGVAGGGTDHVDHFGQSRCASCGILVDRKKLLSSTYKAVLEHFSRFLRFLRMTVNEIEGAAISWPPDEKYVAAAGGVGFGILPFLNGDDSGNMHRRNAGVITNNSLGDGDSPNCQDNARHALFARKEFVIPPVIRYLHPQFSAEDFERHRHDPIFLHKPVAVCEACCLVYADYSTSALEVNSIRQTAPAILRPHAEIPELRRRLDPLDPLATALASPERRTSPISSSPKSKSRKEKPPPSAWQPLHLEHRKGSPGVGTGSVKKARGMLRFASAPGLPERIDSFEDLQDAEFDSLTVDASGGSSRNANAVAEREERFFRELYNNKNIEKGHPLRHMVESSTRLHAIKRSKQQRLTALSGGYGATLMGNTASTGALADAVAENQELAARQSGKSPYSVVQRLRDPIPKEAGVDGSSNGVSEGGNGKSPGKKTEKAKKARKKVQKKVKRVTGEENGTGAAVNGPARFVSSREKVAADEHRSFLFEALSRAQGQLEDMELLMALVPVPSGPETDEDADDSETEHQVPGVTIGGTRHSGTERAVAADEDDYDGEDDGDAADTHDKSIFAADDQGEEINADDGENGNGETDDPVSTQFPRCAASGVDDIANNDNGEADNTAIRRDEDDDEGSTSIGKAIVSPRDQPQLQVDSGSWTDLRLAAIAPLPSSDGKYSSPVESHMSEYYPPTQGDYEDDDDEEEEY